MKNTTVERLENDHAASGLAKYAAGTGRGSPDAIVIAASTGGLQALTTLFSKLGQMISEVPVFVVLHMPKHFTDVVTAQIERVCGCATHAAQDKEFARPGHIYFAPGDRHLVLKKSGLSVSMHLDAGPAVNFCRPSADRLFASAAEIFGGRVVAVVLSGMGNDGCDGAMRIAESGGLVVAQDKETSAVWGMPAAVAEAGIASAILPVDGIAAHIGTLLCRTRKGAAA